MERLHALHTQGMASLPFRLHEICQQFSFSFDLNEASFHHTEAMVPQNTGSILRHLCMEGESSHNYSYWESVHGGGE